MSEYNKQYAKSYLKDIKVKTTVEQAWNAKVGDGTYFGRIATWFYKAIQYKEYEFAMWIAYNHKRSIDKSMIHDLFKEMLT